MWSRNGGIEIETETCKKTIGIHEIHMEEDAGKLVHDEWEDISYVDYNRSGVPLIEIVSEPDLRSAQEVIAYLEKLRMMIQYLGASDCKLQEGSMRADVNLSVRPAGSLAYGTRIEMKNLNSFKAITRAIEHEKNRQIDMIESGGTVIQETRRWDDAKGESYAMRSKEDAKDYRYFPEPDLVPVRISDEWLAQIRARQPEMREARMERYQKQYGLPEYDAQILTGSKRMADIFEQASERCKKPKKVSNWLMGETMRLLRENGQEPDTLSIDPYKLAKLVDLADSGAVNNTVAKEVFEELFARHRPGTICKRSRAKNSQRRRKAAQRDRAGAERLSKIGGRLSKRKAKGGWIFGWTDDEGDEGQGKSWAGESDFKGIVIVSALTQPLNSPILNEKDK